MNTTYLFALRPAFAGPLVNGTKKFEFRRSPPKNLKPGDVMKIYECAPTKLVVGEVEVKALHFRTREEWVALALSFLDLTSIDHARQVPEYGINFTGLDWYFGKREIWPGIEVINPHNYTQPLTLADLGVKTAPQSFCIL